MTKTKKLIFTAFSTAIIILSLYLGVWQVKRNFYKKDLISRYETNVNQASEILTEQDTTSFKENEFKFFQLTGHFAAKKYFGMGPRFRAKTPGYDLHLFFITTDGNEYILNAGFIESEQYKTGNFSLPSDIVTIEGMMRTLGRQNFFMPDNDLETNFWFSLNKEDLLKQFSYEFPGFYFDLIKPNFTFIADAYKKDHLTFYDEHIPYAITWFLLSIVLSILTVIFYRKNK